MGQGFDKGTAEKVQKLYSDVVMPIHGVDARGGCMAAIYNGVLSALYGKQYATSLWRRVYRTALAADKKAGREEGASNSVDLIMETLQKDGLAGEPWVFVAKDSKLQCTSPGEVLGKGVADTIDWDLGPRLIGAAKPYFFYGISASGGYHSVALEVDDTTPGRKIYWLDQFTKSLSQRRTGYLTATPDVTTTLDQILIQVKDARHNRTRMWPLFNNPPPKT